MLKKIKKLGKFAKLVIFTKLCVIIWLVYRGFFMDPITKENRSKYPVKMVIVNFFETPDNIAERHLWLEAFDLKKEYAFPMGNYPLYYNPDTQVLQMTTGQGNINAAVSMTALGLDRRFNITKAYILLAGIAGGDPERISVGSAVWTDYIVDGDLKHSIDPREMPKNWKNGEFPYQKSSLEYPLDLLGSEFFKINPDLLEWAYELTKEIIIPEDNSTKQHKKRYQKYPNAIKNPTVSIGANIAASDYWHGTYKTQWARAWVDYYTEGKSFFVTSAMEDSGVMDAIYKLDQTGYASKERVLSLRTISNYTMPWSGATAYESLKGEQKGYNGLSTSIYAAFYVGRPVITAILENWDKYKDTIPHKKDLL